MRKIRHLIVFIMLSLMCATSFSQEEKQIRKTVQQEKNEIHLDQVPEAIAKALTVDFKGYSVGKVFTSSKNGQYIYTIQLSKDGDAVEANYNTEGKITK